MLTSSAPPPATYLTACVHIDKGELVDSSPPVRLSLDGSLVADADVEADVLLLGRSHQAPQAVAADPPDREEHDLGMDTG